MKFLSFEMLTANALIHEMERNNKDFVEIEKAKEYATRVLQNLDKKGIPCTLSDKYKPFEKYFAMNSWGEVHANDGVTAETLRNVYRGIISYEILEACIEVEKAMDDSSKHKEIPTQKFVGKNVKIKIDRPLGSKHPKHGFFYPVNYGFLPGVLSGDGEELDAYVLGEFAPLKIFEGVVRAVIHRTNDNDDKLVVTSTDKNYTDDQIRALTEFQEQYFESEIYR